jgi:hypothetical protein
MCESTVILGDPKAYEDVGRQVSREDRRTGSALRTGMFPDDMSSHSALAPCYFLLF